MRLLVSAGVGWRCHVVPIELKQQERFRYLVVRIQQTFLVRTNKRRHLDNSPITVACGIQDCYCWRTHAVSAKSFVRTPWVRFEMHEK
jgi:hypothetical protein